MWAVWHTDNRPEDQVQIPVKNDIWTAVFTPAVAAKDASLSSVTKAEPLKPKPGHVDESRVLRHYCVNAAMIAFL